MNFFYEGLTEPYLTEGSCVELVGYWIEMDGSALLWIIFGLLYAACCSFAIGADFR